MFYRGANDHQWITNKSDELRELASRQSNPPHFTIRPLSRCKSTIAMAIQNSDGQFLECFEFAWEVELPFGVG